MYYIIAHNGQILMCINTDNYNEKLERHLGTFWKHQKVIMFNEIKELIST
jgi:hypothetical protein